MQPLSGCACWFITDIHQQIELAVIVLNPLAPLFGNHSAACLDDVTADLRNSSRARIATIPRGDFLIATVLDHPFVHNAPAQMQAVWGALGMQISHGKLS